MHDPSRCQHRDALNRRCRMPRIDTHPALCYVHAKAEREVRDAEFRRNKRATYSGTFYTATDVNQALGTVFTLLSQDRIPARNAAVLACVSQLLLQSIEGVRYETQIALGVDGYQNLVCHVIDPPRRKLQVARNPTAKPRRTAMLPPKHAPRVPQLARPTNPRVR